MHHAAARLPDASPARRAMLLGGLLVGVMAGALAPNEARAEHTHALTQREEVIDDLQEELVRMRKEYEQLRRRVELLKADELGVNRMNELQAREWRSQHAKRMGEATGRAWSLEKQMQRAQSQIEHLAAKVTKSREKKKTLGLYDIANREMEDYMREICNIREDGRSFVVTDAAHERAMVDVGPEFAVDGFDLRNNDFVIVFKKTDGTFMTMKFKDGIFMEEFVSTEQGRAPRR